MKTQPPNEPTGVGDPRLQSPFDVAQVIHELKHYLPAQAPLKDFIHHNTLHAFQHMKFFDALRHAHHLFGYRVSLTLEEYRSLFYAKRVREDILEKVIRDKKDGQDVQEWLKKVKTTKYSDSTRPRIGMLRTNWKTLYKTDLDSLVHPLLFRILCSYLDQGISIWSFPIWQKGFLTSVRELERNSFSSFFRTDRAREFLLQGYTDIVDLLKILVGDPSLYKQYLFDQQLVHPGWSGMASTVEDQPETLLDRKQITLQELIQLELLLEIDAIDYHQGKTSWSPMSEMLLEKPIDLFAEVPTTEVEEVIAIWQEALEWTYFDQVLAGLKASRQTKTTTRKNFQALFCIDDREYSLREYLETCDTACETFGTPGFFGVECFFQPTQGKFYTKLCPAPITPKHLIKEESPRSKRATEIHFTKHTHALLPGWLISQTLGFVSAFKLFLNIFRPTIGPATTTSFSHMDRVSKLSIELTHPDDFENNLQIGFTIDEMAERVATLLRSIGLVNDFAPLVYAIGHGASSVNNPYYAAYDCGACSGRPGSVNARVFCYMANHPKVREVLRTKGIDIPAPTQFIGGLHDTTRDELIFFDEESMNPENHQLHRQHERIFSKALDLNSKERSRRFDNIHVKNDPAKIHELIKKRSVSLFEPRPEMNHATNALCIVGRRALTQGLFLDRRAFLNSYDYTMDPDGDLLSEIMSPLGPVCGGINLEYFFSRVDNQKLGAGTKLPHNVMGLFGVANGIDGDLRPGLPSQMIEIHDPIRLLLVVEHFPEIVLQTIRKRPDTYEWFINEWIHLAVIHPVTKELYTFKKGVFHSYTPIQRVETVSDISSVIESSRASLPVYLISGK